MAIVGRAPTAVCRLGADNRVFAVGALLGCLCAAQQSRLPDPFLILVVTALISGSLCCLRRYVGLLLPAVLGCVLGFAYANLQGALTLNSRLPVELHAQTHQWQGVITGLPTQTQTGQGILRRFLFEPREAPVKRIRVAWYQAEARPAPGECWELRLKLRAPRGGINPGGYDYEGWLFQQGIDATATVQQARPCAETRLWTVDRLRDGLAMLLRASLAEHAMLPIVLGLTVGERSEISDDQWRVLRRTGIAHLLAISGLHIGLIAGFVFLLVNRSWRYLPQAALCLPAPKAAALAAALAAAFYAAMAGFSLPTQRALVMLGVVLLGLWLGHRTQPSRQWAWALLLVLIIDPFAGQSAGFWLSFAAVGWILYALSARLQVAQPWVNWLWLQCLLGMSLLPLSLLWFNEGSVLAPIVNLLLIPAFFILVPVLLIGALLLPWAPPAGSAIVMLVAQVLQGLWRGLEWLEAQAPVLALSATPSWIPVLLAGIGLAWLLAPRGWPARGVGGLLCLPLLLGPLPERLSAGELQMTVLDVGQGLAVVLRTPEHVMLYDSGPAWPGGFDAGRMVVLPYLRQQGIRQIDRYVQSHGDLDHRGGSASLRREIPILSELGSRPDQPCRGGAYWQWDEVVFEVLHPQGPDWSGNDASCVIRVSVGEHAVLLTGDIERDAELSLLTRHTGALKATVLLVPHHGSNSSSSMGLLHQVAPELAVVSSGWRNRWGLPNPAVLRRYQLRGIHWLNTADSGAISLTVHPDRGVENLQQSRTQQKRFWHAD